jgi:hypothetical protein
VHFIPLESAHHRNGREARQLALGSHEVHYLDNENTAHSCARSAAAARCICALGQSDESSDRLFYQALIINLSKVNLYEQVIIGLVVQFYQCKDSLLSHILMTYMKPDV